LGNARKNLLINLYDVAGRETYMAAFHAAQALIFLRFGKKPITHGGVHALFGKIAIEEGCIDRGLARFLAEAYTLKENADYCHEYIVTFEEATETVHMADAFVRAVARLVEEP
jgi:uncharacterized protein (UPF0332 family)